MQTSHIGAHALATLLGLLAALLPAAPSAAQRVAPPEGLACPRDRLTVYSGAVLSYQRTTGQTSLRIRTDSATTESMRIRNPGSRDPSRQFLIERAPFAAADWARIESAPGKLNPGMRAAAWVCNDGTPTLVDWMPPPQ